MRVIDGLDLHLVHARALGRAMGDQILKDRFNGLIDHPSHRGPVKSIGQLAGLSVRTSACNGSDIRVEKSKHPALAAGAASIPSSATILAISPIFS